MWNLPIRNPFSIGRMLSYWFLWVYGTSFVSVAISQVSMGISTLSVTFLGLLGPPWALGLGLRAVFSITDPGGPGVKI
jgi:hypothetical protein